MPTSVSAQTGGDGKNKLGTDEIRKLLYHTHIMIMLV